MTTNTQLRLSARPEGELRDGDFEVVRGEIPRAQDGTIVVRVDLLSIDPAMRSWMNAGESYVPPVEIGEVMRALGVGTVVESRRPGFEAGQLVQGLFGVQNYALTDGRGIRPVDTAVAPPSAHLGVLGMPGLTAYFGLLDKAGISEGDTVVISGAAGAVGSVAGQIARISGCRTIGIAGGPQKCHVLTDSLGFDHAIDYKRDDVAAKLAEFAPDGVDVYLDNVGGPILDDVLARLARGARIVLSGAVSQYNQQAFRGPANYMELLIKRATMTGMIVFDYVSRYSVALTDLGSWLRTGDLTPIEHVVNGGVEDFPAVLRSLFAGANTGKTVLALTELAPGSTR